MFGRSRRGGCHRKDNLDGANGGVDVASLHLDPPHSGRLVEQRLVAVEHLIDSRPVGERYVDSESGGRHEAEPGVVGRVSFEHDQRFAGTVGLARMERCAHHPSHRVGIANCERSDHEVSHEANVGKLPMSARVGFIPKCHVRPGTV